MKRVKKRIFYGAVCEQEVYTSGDGSRSLQPKRPRFETEEERRAHREQVAFNRFYRNFMATFDSSSLYSTLTFDREHEILTDWEAEEVLRSYVRSLRRINPAAQLSIHIGLGDHGRIHLHMVSNGLTKKQIETKWRWGSSSRIKNLWKTCKDETGRDIGADYIGLCKYLFEHRRPGKETGRRYFATKNWRKPDEERPVRIIREYTPDKPPRAPKGYTLISCKCTSYGYLSFKYVKLPAGASGGSPPTPKRE